MFNKDFYPTPEHVITQMLFNVELKGKVILEPSAGSGNIVDYLTAHGAKEVLACEKDPRLNKILSGKCRFLWDDFLQVQAEAVSHINLIVMNPPFSADEKHILHAWEIAPEGCQIIALCNAYTYEKSWHSNHRQQLKQLTNEHGFFQNIGNVFSDAERETEAEIGLINLFKPNTGEDTEFKGYFDMIEGEEPQENGIMAFSDVREVVNRYVGSVKLYNSAIDSANTINSLMSPINNAGIKFGAFEYKNGDYRSIDRETFKKELQKSAWRSIFAKMDMNKYVTSSVMSDINKFVEQQSQVPFTVANVYKMIEVIVGTHGSRMERVVMESFDNITKYHDENRLGVEGWKTNDKWMVNRRFILPWMFEVSYRGAMNARIGGRDSYIDDLMKALCYLTGKKWEDVGHFYSFCANYTGNGGTSKGLDFNTWYEFGFIRFKGYKKGTMHAEFIDEKVWKQFNMVACKAKGWQLPESTTHSYKRKETGVEVF